MTTPMHADPSSTGLNRRGFLKTSALAASSAVAGMLPLARSAHAAGSDVIRLGMIGCGGRNTGAAAQALSADPGVRLVAMCDFFMDRVKAKREHLRTIKGDQVQVDDDHCFAGFEGYRHVIEASDVVVIANAAKFHPFHAMAAIRAGRHVFVEKPHGIDPAGIHLMQQAGDLAREKRRCLVSGLQSRYHTGYIETIQRIHDGAIGDIMALQEHWLRAPYGLGLRAPGHTELQWQVSVQYRFRWLSGDDVPQTLVHNLDRVSWVMHNAAPVRCHGLGGRSSMVDAEYGDVFDHHAVVYQFADGTPLYAFCRTTPGCHDENSSVVIGSKGRASLMNCRITGETNWRWEGKCDPYQREHDLLFAAIRSGQPINNGDYMARSTMIGVMGQISCYTGKAVTWDQVMESNYHYPPKPEECRDDMEPPTRPGPDGTYPVPKPGFSQMI
ncbi:MAG TPA: Gfo/Idh/MocA family oxidoreductase [Candidatus Paceibacterota bacterium]|nr:Gfo/Idh/MocA family oxidoreductase [Verrucomicrobiota bacterium]HOX04433.1 Gfo/Idh/MocA family oxidoreductase [Verrucomicrobiota bacterium]HRZ47377.1 Gfo/Idh/MocA family oxidoreductase [Candidatus Paceibacterota bacterium]HRZ92207.1 Gfo/Idh/MocA family oxidoreductase [Candidatus Paceibacterota bacterium]